MTIELLAVSNWSTWRLWSLAKWKQQLGNLVKNFIWLGRLWRMILQDLSWLWMHNWERFMPTLSSKRTLLWHMWITPKRCLDASMCSLNLAMKWTLVQSQCWTLQSGSYQMSSKTSSWDTCKNTTPAARIWKSSMHDSRTFREYNRTCDCSSFLQVTKLKQASQVTNQRTQLLQPRVIVVRRLKLNGFWRTKSTIWQGDAFKMMKVSERHAAVRKCKLCFLSYLWSEGYLV